jgi:hypothetical protein
MYIMSRNLSLPGWSIFIEGAIGVPPPAVDALGRRLRRLLRQLATALVRPIVYAGYEAHLFRQVRGGRMPRHVGIIVDGNRRHAREAGLSDFRRIYAVGASKLDEVPDWCAELGVRSRLIRRIRVYNSTLIAAASTQTRFAYFSIVLRRHLATSRRLHRLIGQWTVRWVLRDCSQPLHGLSYLTVSLR